MSHDLFIEERREQIVAVVQRDGRASVTQLSEQFGLSNATIRGDLDSLARQGLLVRTRGGAIAIDDRGLQLDFHIRRQMNREQKDCIGRVAATMVQDGDAIVLDASTTVLTMVDRIRDRRRLTVLTNGLLVVTALMESPGIEVVMPGGFLYRDSASLVGRGNREFFSQFIIQRGFYSAKGLTLEEGLTDINSAEVAIKRDLVSQTKQVIALVDSSKWEHVGFASFASVDQLHTVISDAGAPPDMVTALREAGVNVVIAR